MYEHAENCMRYTEFNKLSKSDDITYVCTCNKFIYLVSVIKKYVQERLVYTFQKPL